MGQFGELPVKVLLGQARGDLRLTNGTGKGKRNRAEARITWREWAEEFNLDGMRRKIAKRNVITFVLFVFSLSLLFVFFLLSSRAKRSPKQRRRHQINGSPTDAEKDRLITTDSDGTYKRPPGVNNSAYIVCMSFERQECSDNCNDNCNIGRLLAF